MLAKQVTFHLFCGAVTANSGDNPAVRDDGFRPKVATSVASAFDPFLPLAGGVCF
jgi:hypothetical protein